MLYIIIGSELRHETNGNVDSCYNGTENKHCEYSSGTSKKKVIQSQCRRNTSENVRIKCGTAPHIPCFGSS
jgi:hypothetical protein